MEKKYQHPKYRNLWATKSGRIFMKRKNKFVEVKGQIGNHGYRTLCFFIEGTKIQKTKLWHGLIFEAISGTLPEWGCKLLTDLQCDHLNNDRLDNRFENLQVVTFLQNLQKMFEGRKGTK